MTHSIFNSALNTEIIIDETLCENVCITIDNRNEDCSITHYLNPEQLDDLINILSYIKNKKNIMSQSNLTKLCKEIRLRESENFRF